jgi:methionyl aminopeptidase
MNRLKSPQEIEKIRISCRLLSETLKAVKKIVGEGITTRDIDFFIRDYCRKLGATPAFLDYQGYPAAICTSVNETVIHGIPNKRKLRTGDIISLDCGLEYQGFFSDAAFTLPIGRVSSDAERLMKVTRECLDKAVSKAVTGNRINDISRAVYDHAKANGYGVVREYCGHGVGFSQHEEPQVPNYVGRGPNPRLKEGMILAIEPMINGGKDDILVLEDGWTVVTEDGSLSAHYEHTVAIFRDRTEILTDWD